MPGCRWHRLEQENIGQGAGVTWPYLYGVLRQGKEPVKARGLLAAESWQG